MRRWIELWSAYWFPEAPSQYLSLSRIIAVAAQLFWFLPSLGHQVNLLEKNPEFLHPQLLIRTIAAVVPRDVFFTPPVFTALYGVTVVAGVMALVGLFTRTSVFLFALGSWIFASHDFSYAYINHHDALFAIFLMLLAFSPSGESFSLDALIRRRRGRFPGERTDVSGRTEMAMWPLKLAHVLLAMTYFSTGITKILSGGGLQWMNGYTLQGYLFSDGVRREIPVGIWLGQQYTPSLVLSVLTVLFEVFFFVSLLLPRAAPLFFVGGIFFHIGLFVVSGHRFFQHIVLLTLLLLFLDPKWWQAWLKKYADVYLSRWRTPGQARQALD